MKLWVDRSWLRPRAPGIQTGSPARLGSGGGGDRLRFGAARGAVLLSAWGGEELDVPDDPVVVAVGAVVSGPGALLEPAADRDEPALREDSGGRLAGLTERRDVDETGLPVGREPVDREPQVADAAAGTGLLEFRAPGQTPDDVQTVHVVPPLGGPGWIEQGRKQSGPPERNRALARGRERQRP